MGCYSAVKRNEVRLRATAGMNPENRMLSARSQMQKGHTLYDFISTKCSRRGKSIDILEVDWGWREGSVGSDCLMNRKRIYFVGMKILELDGGDGLTALCMY